VVNPRTVKIKNYRKENGVKMENLTDEALVRAYLKALDLNLAPDFIHVFKEEIEKRELCLDDFDLTSIK